jgi:hypothetical protein
LEDATHGIGLLQFNPSTIPTKLSKWQCGIVKMLWYKSEHAHCTGLFSVHVEIFRVGRISLGKSTGIKNVTC